jgi:hypothetical protein
MKRRTYFEIVDRIIKTKAGKSCRHEATAAYKAVAREAVRRYKMRQENLRKQRAHDFIKKLRDGVDGDQLLDEQGNVVATIKVKKGKK